VRDVRSIRPVFFGARISSFEFGTRRRLSRIFAAYGMKGFPESRDARFTGLSAALAATV